jgi:ubiquinone/menaquinone biosynthesis C-methylase UbiE
MGEVVLEIFFVLLAGGICVWCVYMLVGEIIGGAAFVPTNLKEVEELLKILQIKPGQVFYDLGSGDGRVVKLAVKKYQAKGLGIEINPWLIWWSRWTSKKMGLKNIQFLAKNFWGLNLSEANYIYFYMSQRSATRLIRKAKRECKTGTIIISKAFEAKGEADKLAEKWGWNNKRYWMYKI